MRLVWTIIPLVLLSIISIQESFAEESKITIIGDGVEPIQVIIDQSLLLINIDAEKSSTIDVVIPKNEWYITGLDCKPVQPIAFVDGEEIDVEISFTDTDTIYTLMVREGSEQIKFTYGYTFDGRPTVFQMGKDCWDAEKIKFMPPLKQINNGVLYVDVICKEGLELIFKAKIFSPACVNFFSAQQLITRGWAGVDTKICEYFGGQWIIENFPHDDIFKRDGGFLLRCSFE